jgi:hypothetical protein
MAKKTQPDLYIKMLNLAKFSLCVGILGLITAVVIGVLQLRGGGHLNVIERTVKTMLAPTPDKTGDKKSQPAQLNVPAQRPASSGHAASKASSAASGTTQTKTQPALTTSRPIPVPTWIVPPPSGSSTSTAATPTKPLKHGDRKDRIRGSTRRGDTSDR